MQDPYAVAISNIYTPIILQIAGCFKNDGSSSDHRTATSSECLTTNLAFPLHAPDKFGRSFRSKGCQHSCKQPHVHCQLIFMLIHVYFRGFQQPRKVFNNEPFPIYGLRYTSYTHTIILHN